MGGAGGSGGVSGAGGVSGSGGVTGSGGTGGAGGCTTDECGNPPPYSLPVCASGMHNDAYCARGTDGLCHWNPPTCIPCANVECPAIAQVCTETAQAQIVPSCGCPCSPPVATQ